MEDYKEELRKLLLNWYSPIAERGTFVTHTTAELLEMFQGVLPAEPISEHDVYEVCKEESFEIIKTEDHILKWKLHDRI